MALTTPALFHRLGLIVLYCAKNEEEIVFSILTELDNPPFM